MEIIKKINNNVALARDTQGHELIVFGKGVGFPAMPYTLTDLACVQRTFYDVGDKYFELLRALPEAVFLAAGDIAESARDELDCPLNPNLPFALADHLNFAIERSRSGVALKTPLAYDVQHLYPQEYALGREGLHILRQHFPEVEIPEDEAVSIAMHIINAEAEAGDMHTTMLMARIITELTDLVEEFFEISLDKQSFSYSRFAMHLRYLVQRMAQGEPLPTDPGSDQLFYSIRREYPSVYTCVQRIDSYLASQYGWHCTREEQLYLIMHIQRVRVKQQPECGDL